ncbi:MAG: helix-turn-helix transcriptional regulator [Myxococcales bacterium]|nr:helix-turn-helix transcriptional regulator [Myxococcales bacterium]MCB9752668.1 helix-turn-helix transcriptional regulator [Myxococcales bacterium]
MSVSNVAGRVVGQNAQARALAGVGFNSPCWQVHTSIKGASGLPCSDGCAQALLRGGQERAQTVTIRGREHRLCCAPVNGKVVSVLFRVESRERGVVECDATPTPREHEVLSALAEGHTVPAIAKKLGLRASTVRAHVEHLRKKLNAPTQAALVATGFRLGLLR